MLNIVVFAHKLPTWLTDARDAYFERLPSGKRPKIHHLPPAKGMSAQERLQDEALRIQKISKNSQLVLLSSEGKTHSSESFATFMNALWQQDTTLVIGSADGFLPDLKKNAQLISLSKLTFGHALVQLILAEQIYRAWTILEGHPYHTGH